MTRGRGQVVVPRSHPALRPYAWGHVGLAVAFTVCLFLPAVQTHGKLFEAKLLVIDVHPVAIGVLLTAGLALASAGAIFAGRARFAWIMLLPGLPGIVFFGLVLVVGGLITNLVSVKRIRDYESLGIGPAVTALLVLCVAVVPLCIATGIVTRRCLRSPSSTTIEPSVPAMSSAGEVGQLPSSSAGGLDLTMTGGPMPDLAMSAGPPPEVQLFGDE